MKKIIILICIIGALYWGYVHDEINDDNTEVLTESINTESGSSFALVNTSMPYLVEVAKKNGIEIYGEEILDEVISKSQDISDKYDPIYVELIDNKLTATDYSVRNDNPYMYLGEIDENNHPIGFGILVSPLGEGYILLTYTGYFKDGKYDGFGVTYSNDEDSRRVYDLYENSYNIKDEDKIEHVVLARINHPTYIGNFQEGHKSGLGTYVSYTSINKEIELLETAKKYLPYDYKSIEEYKEKLSELVDKNNPQSELIEVIDNLSPEKNMKIISGELTLKSGDFYKSYIEGNVSIIEHGYLSYKGEFSSGVKEGKGTSYDENGSIIYSGEWVNGEPLN